MIALLLAGCTLEPGDPFATVGRATAGAWFEAGAARDLGDGWFLTDQAFRVRFDRATLGVGDVVVSELVGAGAFDPSDPPEGYTLCHGGHCHSEDGALVDYVDVIASLGDATFEPVLALRAASDADLLAGGPARVAVEPSPELSLVTLSRGEVALGGLLLDATVTGGALGEAVAPLHVDLDVGGVATDELGLVVDRYAPSRVALDARLVLDGTLLDGLDLSAGLVIDDPSDPGADALIDALLTQSLEVSWDDLAEDR